MMRRPNTPYLVHPPIPVSVDREKDIRDGRLGPSNIMKRLVGAELIRLCYYDANLIN